MSRPRTPWGGGWIIPEWKGMSFHGRSSQAACGRTEPTDFCIFGDSGRTSEGAPYMHTCGRACACAQSVTLKCPSISLHLSLGSIQLTNKPLHSLGIVCLAALRGKNACLLPSLYARIKVSFHGAVRAALPTLPGRKGAGRVPEARKPASLRGWKGRKRSATIPPHVGAQARAHVRRNYNSNPSDHSELINKAKKEAKYNGLPSEGWRRDRSTTVPATEGWRRRAPLGPSRRPTLYGGQRRIAWQRAIFFKSLLLFFRFGLADVTIGNIVQLSSMPGMPSIPRLRLLIARHRDFPIITRGTRGRVYQIDLDATAAFIGGLRKRRQLTDIERRETIRALGLEFIQPDAKEL